MSDAPFTKRVTRQAVRHGELDAEGKRVGTYVEDIRACGAAFLDYDSINMRMHMSPEMRRKMQEDTLNLKDFLMDEGKRDREDAAHAAQRGSAPARQGSECLPPPLLPCINFIMCAISSGVMLLRSS